MASSMTSDLVADYVVEFLQKKGLLVKGNDVITYYDDYYNLKYLDGSYQNSPYLLIHRVMYYEGYYALFLDERQLKDVEAVINEEPDAIYKADAAHQDFLDEVYGKALREIYQRCELTWVEY